MKTKKIPVQLNGAVCVVTGASSGLGRRFAVDLAAKGAVVVGLARRTDLLEALERELRETSPRSSVARCDVSDVDSFVARLAAIESEHGRIDVLVNCAGIPEPAETKLDRSSEPNLDQAGYLKTALEAYREVMDTNFLSAVAGTISVLPGMRQRGHGVVVNVSSDSARAPGPGEPAYCASKAALSAFSECQALALNGTDVHVHVLYPGWVATAMGLGAVEDGMPMPPKFVRRTEAQVSELLIERMGGPRIDIDAAPVARLALVAKSLAPGAYKKGVIASS